MANETPRCGGKQRRADRLAEPLRPGPGLLERAQHVDRSATGARITPGNAPLMVTIAEQERKVANPRTPNRLRILFSEPFNQVSVILEGFLGLTGMGGLVVERISHSFPGRPVMFLLNVTIEAPRFVFGQAAVYRIPVQDDEKEDLSIYFDEATEKLEQVRRDGLGVAVVNCLVGISRSATIVLGKCYLFLCSHRLSICSVCHGSVPNSLSGTYFRFLFPSLSFTLFTLTLHKSPFTIRTCLWREPSDTSRLPVL